ncbi:MAG: dihydroorotase [Thermoplasmatota archaeon]
MYDLVIEGRVLKDGALVEAYICMEGRWIAKVRRTLPGSGEYSELHRAGKGAVLPGAIDTHVHFRDPGMTAKEDFRTGSISAAFGGVTTVIDMPNTKPPTVDRTSLLQKEEIASRSSVIDYGLNLAILNGSDLLAVDTLARGKGDVPAPAGLKAFLGETTGSLVLDPISSLSRWAPVIDAAGVVLALHAEDGSLFQRIKDPEREKAVLSAHDRSRPAEAEAEAIRKAVEALGSSSERAHILHVSTEKGIEAAASTNASVELTPHHLLLDVKWGERNLEFQGMGKVNPPLRGPSDRAALWKAIADGKVTSVGSDHAPHLLDEKTNGLLSPSGMPGVETMAPLMLNEVSKGRIGLDTFVELCSAGPARRYSIAGRGGIEEGGIADLMIVDLKDPRKIRGDDLHSKCGWTPYENMTGIFPRAVFSRGELLIDGENLCAKPGRGRNIRS